MTEPMTGLSFVTHSEIEGLLGGGSSAKQQRRRMTKRGLLPEPAWVRADRQSLGILPEFVLATLVVPVRNLKSQHGALLSAMVEDANQLCGSASFKRLSKAIREQLPAIGSVTNSAALLDRLMESHGDVLDAWRTDVATAAEQLSRLGLRIEAKRGRIVAIREGSYVLEAPEAGLTEDHPLSDAPFELEDGAWVVRDRVHALSSARDFLLPTCRPELTEKGAAALPMDDADEAMFEEMFAAFDAAPRPVPRLPLAIEDESAMDAPKAPPRLVRAPLELLEGFTPMTRPRV